MLKLSVFVFCTVLLFVSAKEEVYSNSWAVEVKGGLHAAHALAKKHGFVNKGQVGGLEDVYHFVHEESPTREKRHTHILHPKHLDLAAEEHVSYVEQQVVRHRVKRDHSYIYTSPTDSKWGSQWYLHRPSGHHMNVERAWEQDVIGRGAVVSILDDGIEHTHPDLENNYDPLASYDFNNHDDDPFPRYDYSNENKHGTRCAGEVAANRDGKCGVGAAYGAKVGGVRMLDGDVTDVVEASSLSLNPQHIDIYSSSWGPSDDGATIDGPGPLARKAFIDGIEKGRGGLGSLFVWAAGNGGRYGDSCNCDGYAVSPFTISVGSASENDNKPWYLEECSSTLASTYSSGASSEKQIVSTDLHHKCTAHHTGTSAAAPLAAGILALALEANSNLTWRDIQYLLVYTSNPAYPHENHWITNGAGLRVSHLYGFGIIDATALVNRARNWVSVSPRLNCTVNLTKTLTDDTSTPSHPLNVKATFASDCVVSYIEHTQAFVTLKLLAGQRKDVQIKLVSPQGTKSILLPYRNSDRHKDGIHKWPFMTVLTWGESPIGGEWSFIVTTKGGAKAKLLGLELVVHGTHGTPRALRNVLEDCDPECKRGCFAPGPEFCDDCKHFRLSSTLACVEKCPVGTFINHHMCKECPELCTECTDEHTCIQCSGEGVRLDSGLCAAECPALTYLSPDHTCKSCHHSCLSCDGPSDHNCTDCPGQLSLRDGACELRTPESCVGGQYFDHRALECRSCHKTCVNCTGRESTQCTACQSNATLSAEGQCTVILSLPHCEEGQYLVNSSCIDCLDNCTSCSSNTTCTGCVDSLFLTVDGECVEDCPNRTVTDNQTMACLDTSCSDNCLTCFGPDPTSCTRCDDGFLLVGSSCVVVCPPHTFSISNKTCQHCNETCATCDGPSDNNCLSCSTGQLLHENHCLSSCPSGSYEADGVCLSCPDGCIECTSASVCTTCEQGLLLMEKSCVEKCPLGFVAHKASAMCKPCPANCEQCLDTTSCEKCGDGFVYYAPNRECTSTCPDGYYLVVKPNERKCDRCVAPCSTCEGDKKNCLSCRNDFVLDKKTKKCQQCCNSDLNVPVPCCDCDVSTSECVERDSPETQEPLVEDDVQHLYYPYLEIGAVIVIVLVLIFVGAVGYVVVKRQRSAHAGRVSKYKTLDSEAFDMHEGVFDQDDGGSETEIFVAPNRRGYTSVDTIDHDNL